MFLRHHDYTDHFNSISQTISAVINTQKNTKCVSFALNISEYTHMLRKSESIEKQIEMLLIWV